MALLTNSPHCEWQSAAASGRELKALPASPSFQGEVKAPAAGLERLYCNHLVELYLLKYHHAQPGEDGVKEALSSWFGVAAADVAAQAKASELCGFVCSYPTLVTSFSTAGGGLYNSCASQAQLPRVGIARLKALTVLLWCYSKSLLQEGQTLLNTCVSTDTFEQRGRSCTACLGSY